MGRESSILVMVEQTWAMHGRARQLLGRNSWTSGWPGLWQSGMAVWQASTHAGRAKQNMGKHCAANRLQILSDQR
jgi:hypothetical protein